MTKKRFEVNIASATKDYWAVSALSAARKMVVELKIKEAPILFRFREITHKRGRWMYQDTRCI